MTAKTSTDSGALLGRQHHELGAMATLAGGSAAIALSCGGAAKTYDHTEPNEDAAFFFRGPGGWLLAVADGHHGATGSEAVINYIATHLADDWTGSRSLGFDTESWQQCAEGILFDCGRAVLRRAAESGVRPAPTTLSLALIRPSESALAWICMGDSHLFRSGPKGIDDLGWASLEREDRYFLGYEAASRQGMASRSVSGYRDLENTEALVLATDGLSEIGIGVPNPSRAVADALKSSKNAAADQSALETVKHLGETTMETHVKNRAGDNIALAVLDLRPGPS